MKVSRHAKIIELIAQHDIETQEELAEYLNREGFKVTQATDPEISAICGLQKWQWTAPDRNMWYWHRKRMR